MSENKKTDLECEKLGLEIENLRQPVYHRPTFWISVASAIVAIGGTYGQYKYSEIKAEKARMIVLHETIKADIHVLEVNKRVDGLREQERELQTRISDAKENLTSLSKQISDLRQSGLSEEALASIDEGLEGAKLNLNKIDETSEAINETISDATRELQLEGIRESRRLDLLSRQRDLNELIGR